MATKKAIWHKKFERARFRDDKNASVRQKSRVREVVASDTARRTVSNTAVDAYSMKVPFNGI